MSDFSSHIVKDIYNPPSGSEYRSEVVSFCGVWEECSGSGKYAMSLVAGAAKCQTCIERYYSEFEDPEYK